MTEAISHNDGKRALLSVTRMIHEKALDIIEDTRETERVVDGFVPLWCTHLEKGMTHNTYLIHLRGGSATICTGCAKQLCGVKAEPEGIGEFLDKLIPENPFEEAFYQGSNPRSG